MTAAWAQLGVSVGEGDQTHIKAGFGVEYEWNSEVGPLLSSSPPQIQTRWLKVEPHWVFQLTVGDGLNLNHTEDFWPTYKSDLC